MKLKVKPTVKPFPFHEWVIPEFQTYGLVSCGWKTCGAAVISMITGISPIFIEKKFLPKSKEHFSARALVAALDKLGYETKNIGIYAVSNTRDDSDWKQCPIRANNVFILGAWTTYRDQSWFLSHNNRIYHNGSGWDTQGSDFALCHAVTDLLIVRKKK